MTEVKTIISPSPPVRCHRVATDGGAVFDIDALLTARAQRMLAAATPTFKSPNSVRTPKPPHSSGDASPTSRRQRYPLEWDVRAVPLLCLAESEARNATLVLEREHRIGLLAAIHVTKVMVYYKELFSRLELRDEPSERRQLHLAEREGRRRLWVGHEELIVTQQLKELDVTREAALQYLHRPSVMVIGGSMGSTDLSEDASPSSRQQQGPNNVSNKDEWVLHITYLITYDLALLERKERIGMLREELRERSTISATQSVAVVGAQRSFASRRHQERCDYYRSLVLVELSKKMVEDHLASHVFEEWMWVTQTLYSAALLDAHHICLVYHYAPIWVTLAHADAQRRLVVNEAWHRDDDVIWSTNVAFVKLVQRCYESELCAIVAEENREYRERFVPWIAGVKSLQVSTARRLQAATSIQRCFRACRLGLRGRLVTNKKIGADIQAQRRVKTRFLDRSKGPLCTMEMELETLELVDVCVERALVQVHATS